MKFPQYVFCVGDAARGLSMELLTAVGLSALHDCLYLSFIQESSKHGDLLNLIHWSLN